MHNFKELEIWQLSMVLSRKIYTCTSDFPSEEKFGLISQLRRASVSIPSNIAEGASRSTDKEFRYFITMALGSVFELETQILLSQDLGFLNENVSQEIIDEIRLVQRKLNSFLNHLNSKINNKP